MSSLGSAGPTSTFVAETVFSHESKLELVPEARARGFRVLLYRIHVRSPERAGERVITRVSMGGHEFPEKTIHEGRRDRRPHVRHDSSRLSPRSLPDGRKSNVRRPSSHTSVCVICGRRSRRFRRSCKYLNNWGSRGRLWVRIPSARSPSVAVQPLQRLLRLGVDSGSASRGRSANHVTGSGHVDEPLRVLMRLFCDECAERCSSSTDHALQHRGPVATHGHSSR